jgi:hypothetical protein
MSTVLHKNTPAAQNKVAKGQREADQVRQIAASHGGRVATSASGGRHVITITLHGLAEDDPKLRGMLYAIEFATRGQFDRGRAYQGLTQYTARSRLVDVVVRVIN